MSETVTGTETISSKPKVFYTPSDLKQFKSVEMFLIENLIPKIGVSVLVGRPDTGKTQFSRQLAISIANGDTQFCEFELTPTYFRSIYISTEDGLSAIKHAFSKQQKGFDKEIPDNIFFMPTETMTTVEIIKELDHKLSETPVDLIVADSFGDLFDGRDANNTAEIRKALKPYHNLAIKHKCAVLFIHHLNKSGYDKSPSQVNVMGGAGLTQKARTVLQITDTDTSERYLTIVKGNYTSKEFKSKSTVLNFDEDTLLFSNTGKFVESKSIGENSGGIRSSPSKELLLKNQLNDILSPNPLNHTDLVQQLMNKLSVSESTAKRRITSALNHELISSDGSLYSLKNEEPITENT